MTAPWREEEKKQLDNISADAFAGYANHTLYPALPEVKQCYPPAYIVGLTEHSAARVVYTKETPNVTVTLEEVPCEYMYSNPNG